MHHGLSLVFDYHYDQMGLFCSLIRVLHHIILVYLFILLFPNDEATCEIGVCVLCVFTLLYRQKISDGKI